MPYYQFSQDDVIRNTVKTFPKSNFFIYGGVIYYNDQPYNQGELTSDSVKHIPPGFVSLYEYNIDRPSGQLIYPFITKNGSLTSFKTISTKSFNEDFNYGDVLTGSYPLSASISRDYYSATDTSRVRLEALENTVNFYKTHSEHYAYSSTSGTGWNKETQALNLIRLRLHRRCRVIQRGIFVINWLLGFV